MVDAVVSFAVERLVKLGDFLIQEVIFLQNVRDEVEWLKRELGMMQGFLKDAEEKQDAGDNKIRQWISEIRDVAYATEDVIDTFILKVKVERTPERGFLASVKKCSCIFNKEIHKEIDLYNIGKEIETLKKRVVDISSWRDTYGIRNIGDAGEGTGGAIGKLRQLRRTCSYAGEQQVVGFDDVVASLVDEVLKEEPRRRVISILGMGGLGKTTLARKLYHHSKVEGRFEYRGWVCVSQEHRIRDQLLQRIIRSFKQFNKEELEMLEKMAEEDLDRHLRDFLEGHRYLVVIDDVWHKEAWESLRSAFPVNSNGSRVIITTRIKAVAERSEERTYVHELRFLRSDESWELFCKKAFLNHNTRLCPPDLETLGREMVAKCGGLPLAIIVLGGLLFRKQPHEWHTVKEHLWRDLRNDSIHIEAILALSFNDLPYQLKPCFLYLGLFPDDFEINAEKLIRLWVAEGFIPLRDQETLEEVAEDWLNELIGRSLIQVAKRSWRRIRAYRVHDLLRDLAVEKAKELNFLHIYDRTINSVQSSTPFYRRQAAHSMIERYVSVDYSNPYLRTLLFFNPDLEPINIKWLKIIHTRFRLLRVLDLHSVTFSNSKVGSNSEVGSNSKDGSNSKVGKSLPDAVGELIYLRYLGLKDTMINELPPSIVNLQALQTLDAFSGINMRIPGDICKLKQLRHLIGCFEGPLQVDHLTDLQTLKFVYIQDWININPENLSNLRELHLNSKQTVEESEFTLDSIANLRNLQSLSVELFVELPSPLSPLIQKKLPSTMYFPSFQPLSHCQNLVQLMIYGRIKNLPEQMHEYLPNLKYLQLRKSQFMQDPMPTLEKLPYLMILDLQYSDDLKKLTCTAKGFPRLEVLKLYGLLYLEELEVEEGSMPMLKAVDIDMCTRFMVPERLRSIPDAMNLNWDWDWVNPYK